VLPATERPTDFAATNLTVASASPLDLATTTLDSIAPSYHDTGVQDAAALWTE